MTGADEPDPRSAPSGSLEWVVQRAFDDVAQDEALQGSLNARGYVPLLEWIEERALPVAAWVAPDGDAPRAVEMVARILRRLLQAAVWAAETGDVGLLTKELATCPSLILRRDLAIADLSRLVLDDDADGNAEMIAAALQRATPAEL